MNEKRRGGYILITGPFAYEVLQNGLQLPDGFTIVDYREPPLPYDPQGMVVYVTHPALDELEDGQEYPQLSVVYHQKWVGEGDGIFDADNGHYELDYVEVKTFPGMSEVVITGQPDLDGSMSS